MSQTHPGQLLSSPLCARAPRFCGVRAVTCGSLALRGPQEGLVGEVVRPEPHRRLGFLVACSRKGVCIGGELALRRQGRAQRAKRPQAEALRRGSQGVQSLILPGLAIFTQYQPSAMGEVVL